MYQEIKERAETLLPFLRETRRNFHQFPELGWLEVRTSSQIARYLADLGYEVFTGSQVCEEDSRMGLPEQEQLLEAYERAVRQGADPEFAQAAKDGFTGAVGVFHNGDGPVYGLRFDIDALPIPEAEGKDHIPRQKEFASANPGVMHACGHDGHAAIGMGTARVLMEMRESWKGTVKLIFQPAEEGVRGALAVADKGWLDDVDYLFGAHITNSSEDETARVYPGTAGALATSKIDAVFHGQSAHAGGNPELGKNSLLAAANAAINLYAIPRHSDGKTRVNAGVLQAGTGRNVIPDIAKLLVEIRGETTELNEFMETQAIRIMDSAAAMYENTVEYKYMGSACTMTCDQEVIDQVRAVCQEMEIPVSKEDLMVMGGSEDYSVLLARVQQHGGQGTFFRLLTPLTCEAHMPEFDYNEEVLMLGVEVFCGLVCGCN